MPTEETYEELMAQEFSYLENQHYESIRMAEESFDPS